jgi:hypothetical protein
MLWILCASALALIVLCAGGTLSRGRDFFYPMAATGTGVAMAVLAFCDASLGNPAIAILAVATVGLGLAQSVSRTI